MLSFVISKSECYKSVLTTHDGTEVEVSATSVWEDAADLVPWMLD